MKRHPDAEDVDLAEYDRIRSVGQPCTMAVGSLKDGYYYDGWFYTNDGAGCYRVPCPRGVLTFSSLDT